ncbi:TetR-like C-terminal domain-containing protein [Bacillus sp. B15-48]|uniref:TetR/AcrR family transcriptional regulator n=1 Tax=Bacillus sp. B15-48 TaxID=1548601 RepID=UPI00193F3A28|nr:TetR-like C-terminal domain-containing protein [Bacillus sp. B15-48]MBM4761039.1 TetR family transcriptional regulator [Bacillus sp. B15-48]
MGSKIDRRKQYTRMVLKESLMQLLKEKSISAITVKEICELADINRSTFYAHYSDQYDLLSQIEAEMIQDMNETLMQYSTNKAEEALEMTEKIIEYIAANSDVCKTLLSEPGFKKRIMKVAHDFMVKHSLSTYPIDDHQISEYVSLFAVSGSIHILEHWLQTGMGKSPKEMAEMINNLINKGLASMQ